MPLDHDDSLLVLDAAAVLAADPAPAFDTVLELLRSAITSTSASFNDMTFATGDFRYVIVPPDNDALAARLKPFYDRFAHQHPLISRTRSEPDAGALRFCDVPGGAEFTDTDLYRWFYEPFGLRFQLAIELPSPPDVVVGYALNRSAAEGEFSDRDVAVLNALHPHLAMHHRVVADRDRTRALADQADLDGWVVMAVRSDGVMEGSSSAATKAMFAGGRVPAELAAVVASCGTRSGAGAQDVMFDGTHWRCVVRPNRFGPSVVLLRRAGDESSEAAPLIDLGLTPRQTEVALQLARTGGTNIQLARALGMSPGTVKKHLETVFRVLGVDSRTAAVVALRARQP